MLPQFGEQRLIFGKAADVEHEIGRGRRECDAAHVRLMSAVVAVVISTEAYHRRAPYDRRLAGYTLHRRAQRLAVGAANGMLNGVQKSVDALICGLGLYFGHGSLVPIIR